MASLLKQNTTTMNELLAAVQALPEALDTSDATAAAVNMLAGETAYVNGEKVIGTMPNNGATSLSMDGVETTSVSIPAGYTSGGKVTLDGTVETMSAEHVDLIEQISSALEGKSIEGLADTISLQAKSVTPTKSQQTVTADSGYDGLSQVTVAAIPSKYEDVTTPLADLNAVNGGTSASTMSAAVDQTEALTGTQASIISQLQTALEGKAGGSGSGTIIDTCSISVTCEVNYIYSLIATILQDGEIVTICPFAENAGTSYTLDNVICGTTVYLEVTGSVQIIGYTVSGGERVHPDSGSFNTGRCLVKMPTKSGTNVTVTVYNND